MNSPLSRPTETSCTPSSATPRNHKPQPPQTHSLYQRLVLSRFARMRHGALEMTLADGSTLRFGEPHAPATAKIHVLNPQFFKRCVWHGDIGFGEAYVDGDWDTPSIKDVISWFILNVESAPGLSGSKSKPWLLNWFRYWNRVYHLRRPNSLANSKKNIQEHYDLGNAFYRLWLDPTMTYSSAWFVSPELSLEQAQIAKYDALCRKLRLKSSDRVLEIGTGWGGFASHAVRNYGCQITTLTLSEEQHRFASDRFLREGISSRAQVLLKDYRLVTGSFDKIASIEMLEAVGDAYLESFFQCCHNRLSRDGLLGLQYITCPDSRYDELKSGVDWIQKHIFPGSLLLSVDRVTRALRATGDLGLFHLDDLGLSYARTLRLWAEAFNGQEPAIRDLGFDTPFIRKWNYYLSYCEAAFARRNVSVVQAIYTRPNNASLMESKP